MINDSEMEFRRFIQELGPWFEGMAKFVSIVNRHGDFYTGESSMLKRLTSETHRINQYVMNLRERFEVEGDPVDR